MGLPSPRPEQSWQPHRSPSGGFLLGVKAGLPAQKRRGRRGPCHRAALGLLGWAGWRQAADLSQAPGLQVFAVFSPSGLAGL